MSIARKIIMYISVIILLIIMINAFGSNISRTYPRLLTYFSLHDGPFSWEYTFTNGKVGIFEIGMTTDTVVSNIAMSDTDYYLYDNDGNNPRIKINKNIAKDIVKYMRNNNQEHLIMQLEYGLTVTYFLNFKNDKLISITATSSLLEGL